MLIISQDKEKIINLDMITIIKTTEYGERFAIEVDYLDSEYEIIAKYESKEEAKKVLQEIVEAYRDYRTAECDGHTNVLQETAVFEIPAD